MANPYLISPQAVSMPCVVGARHIESSGPKVAEPHTGHGVSGASPFRVRRQLPIHVERSTLDWSRIYLNGASHGFLVAMEPHPIARRFGGGPAGAVIPR